jgi:hypothetical protein
VAAGLREYPGHNGDSVPGARSAVVWLRAAGGPALREQPLGGALLGGVGEPLPVHFAGELGELVHDGPSFLPVVSVVFHCRHQRGRSPCVTVNRMGTGLGHRIRLGGEAMPARAPG